MHVFLIGLGILLALLLAARIFVNADPQALAKTVRRIGGFGLLALAVLFTVTGAFALAIPAAIMGFMLLRRGTPFGMGFPGGFNPFPGNARKSAGQQSRVRTLYLEMMLDHDTGAMEGLVLKGRFKDKILSSLNADALVALWRECDQDDPQSGQLLAAYLDRTDPEWRSRAGVGAGPGSEHGPAGGPMSVDEAYEVLGLEPGASPDDIRRAHRALMKRLHPDQGGSTYLAAKINEAKDLLLGH